jgi:hypothetical protein
MEITDETGVPTPGRHRYLFPKFSRQRAVVVPTVGEESGLRPG